MKLSCLFGHKWNGCTCIRCGEVRDDGHRWNACTCEICGKVQDRDDAHRWNGCMCEVCGKKRDEGHVFADFRPDGRSCVGRCKCGKTQVQNHDYWPVKGKCRYVCKRCGAENNNAHHTWERIPGTCTKKCAVCGETRNVDWEEHDWQRLEGRCAEKCATCGLERSIEHTWEDVEGTCTEKCAVCGETREKHDYVDGRCSRCGVQSPEAFMEDCVEKLLAIFPTAQLDYEGHQRFDAAHREEVRRIGEQLDRLGGMRAMRRVGMEFARRRPIHARKLETIWNGIGNWMG